MIEPEDYRLPCEQEEKPKKNPKGGDEMVALLEEQFGFRPFTCEW